MRRHRLQRPFVPGRNGYAANTLPPDYVLASQAHWAGLNSPENTLQSFLWAVRRGDFANFLRVLTPESGRRFQEASGHSGQLLEEFGKMSQLFVGMRKVNDTVREDGAIQAQVEIVPGQTFEPPFLFRRLDGEWRLDFR